MLKWVWWFIRGVIYSGIIFAFLYLFIILGAIPNLWEGYVKMFTISTTIIISIVCGFVFVTINDFFFGKKDEQKRR